VNQPSVNDVISMLLRSLKFCMPRINWRRANY